MYLRRISAYTVYREMDLLRILCKGVILQLLKTKIDG
jgi:hypothetical protein